MYDRSGRSGSRDSGGEGITPCPAAPAGTTRSPPTTATSAAPRSASPPATQRHPPHGLAMSRVRNAEHGAAGSARHAVETAARPPGHRKRGRLPLLTCPPRPEHPLSLIHI